MIYSSEDLQEAVDSYMISDSPYEMNYHRNHILLSVVNGNAVLFISIVQGKYESEYDLVEKKKIIELLYEIVSRTEKIFDFFPVLNFLSKCVKVTVCLHHSVMSIKSIMERHMNSHEIFSQMEQRSAFAKHEHTTDTQRADNVKSGNSYGTIGKYDFVEFKVLINELYMSLLSCNMYQYNRECRMDFLWITHYILDFEVKYKFLNINDIVSEICDAVRGEKDPRNLLSLFELVCKISKNVATSDAEFEKLATLVTVYFPVQFTPPKNDKIGITPMQLKEGLLKCFISHQRLSLHIMEVLLDSLYSEFSLAEESLAVLTDVLYFLESCIPAYGKDCVKKYVGSFVEIVKIELLPAVSPSDNETLEDDLSYRSILNNIDDSLPLEYNLDQASSRKTADDTPIGILEMKMIGEVYYHEWEFVDKKLEIYGKLTRLFFKDLSIHDESPNKNLFIKFLEILKNFLLMDVKDTNVSERAGYILDVLCEFSPFHTFIIDVVIAPAIYRMVNSEDLKTSTTLHLLLGNLLSKILMNRDLPINNGHVGNMVEVLKTFIKSESNIVANFGLNFLILIASSSKAPYLHEILEYLLEKTDFLMYTSYFGKKDAYVELWDDIRVILSIQLIIVIYRNNVKTCCKVDQLLMKMVESIFDNRLNRDDYDLTFPAKITQYYFPSSYLLYLDYKVLTKFIYVPAKLQVSGVQSSHDRGLNVSKEIAELIGIVFSKMHNATLLKWLVKLCIKCLEHSILNIHSDGENTIVVGSCLNIFLERIQVLPILQTILMCSNTKIDFKSYGCDNYKDSHLSQLYKDICGTNDFSEYGKDLPTLFTDAYMGITLYNHSGFHSVSSVVTLKFLFLRVLKVYREVWNFVLQLPLSSIKFLTQYIPTLITNLSRVVPKSIPSEKLTGFIHLFPYLQKSLDMSSIVLKYDVIVDTYISRFIDPTESDCEVCNCVQKFVIVGLSLTRDIFGNNFQYKEIFEMKSIIAKTHENTSKERYRGKHKYPFHDLAVSLLKIEAILICIYKLSDQCGNIFEHIHFKDPSYFSLHVYFSAKRITNVQLSRHLFENGCINYISRYVEFLCPYDYGKILESLSIIKTDNVVKEENALEEETYGMEYSDLFMSLVPLPVNSVDTIITYHLMHFRFNFNIFGDDMHLKYLILDSLFSSLSVEKVVDENLEVYEMNYMEMVNNVILILLSLDISDAISFYPKHLQYIFELFVNVDLGINSMIQLGNMNYMSWLCRRFIVHIFTIVLRVLLHVNSQKKSYKARSDGYGIPRPSLYIGSDNKKSEWLHELLEGNVARILEKTTNIAKGCKIPFCRILALLVINALMDNMRLEFTKERKSQLIKGLDSCLGDSNRKVRRIALLCKRKWLSVES